MSRTLLALVVSLCFTSIACLDPDEPGAYLDEDLEGVELSEETQLATMNICRLYKGTSSVSYGSLTLTDCQRKLSMCRAFSISSPTQIKMVWGSRVQYKLCYPKGGSEEDGDGGEA